MTLPCDVECVEIRRDGSATVVAMSAPHVQREWIVVLIIMGLTVRRPPRRYIGRSPYRFPRARCSRRHQSGT
jgi:hypothetical protein